MQTDKERIKALENALIPFADAARRLNLYGTPCKGAALYADSHNTLYELLAGNDGDAGPVTADHLRQALWVLEVKA